MTDLPRSLTQSVFKFGGYVAHRQYHYREGDTNPIFDAESRADVSFLWRLRLFAQPLEIAPEARLLQSALNVRVNVDDTGGPAKRGEKILDGSG